MKCPFDDPEYIILLGQPCPVCGCLGGDPDEVERLCIDGIIDRSKLRTFEEVENELIKWECNNT